MKFVSTEHIWPLEKKIVAKETKEKKTRVYVRERVSLKPPLR